MNVEMDYNIEYIKSVLVDYIDLIPYKIIQMIDTSLDNLKVKDILELYKKYYPVKFRNIYTIDELKKCIKNKDYNAVLIDIYILSINYSMNYIILQKRITTRNNHRGYRCIGPDIIESPNYILIYSIEKKGGTVYNLIQHGVKVYFNYSELPTTFTNYISSKKVKITKKVKNSGIKKIKLKNN